MGSIYTQMSPKALAAGASPQTLNSKGERRALSAFASLTRKIENGVNAIQKWVPIPLNCSQVPKSVDGWGFAPDRQTLPSLARKCAFALASLTRWRKVRQSHLRPGRQKPSVRHWGESYVTGREVEVQYYDDDNLKCTASIYSIFRFYLVLPGSLCIHHQSVSYR